MFISNWDKIFLQLKLNRDDISSVAYCIYDNQLNVWNILHEKDRHLFTHKDRKDETVKSFFQKQSLISFKVGRPRQL